MSYLSIAAANHQSGDDYDADDWSVDTLNPGDRVWGGVPYPTEYFTDWPSVAQYFQPGYAHALWDALQVSPREGNVRAGVAEYEVLYAVSTPGGACVNNSHHGVGGARQYMISDWQAVLRPTGRVIRACDVNSQGLSPAVDLSTRPC